MLWSRATAQSGCTMALVSLSPCLNYVTGNSSSPTSSCCTRLSSVVQSQPQCLCALLKGGSSSLGIAINQTLALALPGACNVQTPPVSQCNAANGPPASAPTPAYSPADAPADETPDIAPSHRQSRICHQQGEGLKQYQTQMLGARVDRHSVSLASFSC
ncbi:UNVERIFIED_CONTAM: hypothetical protein Sradi_1401300 [Sesamum radiatum]|uniref:Bifunctional inhibitor/plant lipid transfer protein/seed storage helical domain-containing protein n=1 Tax=Sesamum radiatum TaxID=300843 RepID=A0AAW2USM3_SESRA